MNNSRHKRTTIMVLILLGLLIIAYKVMFVSPVEEDSLVSEDIASGERVVGILREVESINFDTSVFQDAKFRSLRSIENILPVLPVGKKNPFSVTSN